MISASATRVRLWREPGTVSHEIPVSGEMSTIWDRRFLLTLRSEFREADVSVSALGRGGWEAIAADIRSDFRNIPGPVRYGLPAIRKGGYILQVWHLAYRSSQITENIMENAVFMARPPISGPPFCVA